MTEFFMPMKPPTTTAQQHKVTGSHFYDPPEVKAAKAKLEGHLAKHIPVSPYICLLYTSLCIESVLQAHGKKGIEDFGYGNGYTYVAEEWGRFLNLLQDVIDVANINVVLTAHAIIRKFEQPNEMGSYDRYELKLGKKTTAQTAPLTKEWADMVLFANYRTCLLYTSRCV